jgi:hypothetical protein
METGAKSGPLDVGIQGVTNRESVLIVATANLELRFYRFESDGHVFACTKTLAMPELASHICCMQGKVLLAFEGVLRIAEMRDRLKFHRTGFGLPARVTQLFNTGYTWAVFEDHHIGTILHNPRRDQIEFVSLTKFRSAMKIFPIDDLSVAAIDEEGVFRIVRVNTQIARGAVAPNSIPVHEIVAVLRFPFVPTCLVRRGDAILYFAQDGSAGSLTIIKSSTGFRALATWHHELAQRYPERIGFSVPGTTSLARQRNVVDYDLIEAYPAHMDGQPPAGRAHGSQVLRRELLHSLF